MISLDPAVPLSLCSLLDGPGRGPPWNMRVFPQRIPGSWRPVPSREGPGSMKGLGYLPGGHPSPFHDSAGSQNFSCDVEN